MSTLSVNMAQAAGQGLHGPLQVKLVVRAAAKGPQRIAGVRRLLNEPFVATNLVKGFNCSDGQSSLSRGGWEARVLASDAATEEFSTDDG